MRWGPKETCVLVRALASVSVRQCGMGNESKTMNRNGVLPVSDFHRHLIVGIFFFRGGSFNKLCFM